MLSTEIGVSLVEDGGGGGGDAHIINELLYTNPLVTADDTIIH